MQGLTLTDAQDLQLPTRSEVRVLGVRVSGGRFEIDCIIYVSELGAREEGGQSLRDESNRERKREGQR